MRASTSIIRGLAYDIAIEELSEVDRSGEALCYVANIYWQDKSGALRHLIRRSRVPETAEVLRMEVSRKGIQALRDVAIRFV